MFSVMGAYALIANNGLIHLGIFIILMLYKKPMQFYEGQEVPFFEHTECFTLMKTEVDRLIWMHLIAFVGLFIARIN